MYTINQIHNTILKGVSDDYQKLKDSQPTTLRAEFLSGSISCGKKPS